MIISLLTHPPIQILAMPELKGIDKKLDIALTMEDDTVRMVSSNKIYSIVVGPNIATDIRAINQATVKSNFVALGKTVGWVQNSNGDLLEFDARTGDTLQFIHGLEGNITRACICESTNSLFASLSSGATFSLRDSDVRYTMVGKPIHVSSLAVSEDGKYGLISNTNLDIDVVNLHGMQLVSQSKSPERTLASNYNSNTRRFESINESGMEEIDPSTLKSLTLKRSLGKDVDSLFPLGPGNYVFTTLNPSSECQTLKTWSKGKVKTLGMALAGAFAINEDKTRVAFLDDQNRLVISPIQ